jgi:hypothetical protein
MTADAFILIGFLSFVLLLFFSPVVIAFSKNHKYRWIILFINVVFGFTLIGWFGALVWSVAGDDLI